MTVEQTEVIDAIGIEQATGKVILTLADHLPWTGAHLLTLQEKLNAYLRFLESDEIYQSYPQAIGCGFVIHICLKYRPTDEAFAFLKQAQGIIESAGFEFVFGPLNMGYSDDNG